MNSGDRLAHFEILGPLGAGGMGEVYRARDTRLGRDVAIKVLPGHLSTNPELRARFDREARTISSLNHPHICTLFDVGREGEIDFLVMELVEGETLAERLARGGLTTGEVLKIGSEIADALHRAHRAGVVHRDLKPGNVMLTRSGAKLMDFGLARMTGLTGQETGATGDETVLSPTITQPLTVEGTLVGTFQYMSPEQMEGKEADARSDIWALGCLLYEMASGLRPFSGSSQAGLIAAILEHPVRPLSGLLPGTSPALDRLVQGCLAKDPEERVQTAHDVKLQLEWVRAEGEGSATGAAPTAPVRRGRRRWFLPVLLGTAVVSVLIGLFLGDRSGGTAPAHSEPYFFRRTYPEQAIFTARYLPDGQTLVLSAAPHGNRPSLFVVRPDAPDQQPLGLDNLHLLAVSSKGELAVLNHPRYSGHHRLFYGTLARIPLEGAAPRDLQEDVREADWSPDGENLAIINTAGGIDRLEYPIGTVLHEAGGYLSDLRVSPDGTLVAFMQHPSKYDDRGSVKVVDREGRSRVLADGFWGLEGLAWAPDGGAVYFSGSSRGTNYAVFRVDLEGHRQLMREGTGTLIIHDIAPDGTWAVTNDHQVLNIIFRDGETNRETDLSWLENGLTPVLTGDARSLAFTDQSSFAGPNYAVTLRPTTGGAITRLGEGIPSEFSADGQSVLATVFSTPPRIMSYPVGAGKAVRLDPGRLENISFAYWIPGSERILASGNLPGQPPRGFLIDADSQTMVPTGPEGLQECRPSPDGLSFIARVGSGWAIFPLSGNEPGRPVQGMGANDTLVRWHPDGSAIYCFDGTQIPASLDRIDLATGQRSTLTTLGDIDEGGLIAILDVAMADDLRTLAYVPWYYRSVLYTVEGAP